MEDLWGHLKISYFRTVTHLMKCWNGETKFNGRKFFDYQRKSYQRILNSPKLFAVLFKFERVSHYLQELRYKIWPESGKVVTSYPAYCVGICHNPRMREVKLQRL